MLHISESIQSFFHKKKNILSMHMHPFCFFSFERKEVVDPEKHDREGNLPRSHDSKACVSDSNEVELPSGTIFSFHDNHFRRLRLDTMHDISFVASLGLFTFIHDMGNGKGNKNAHSLPYPLIIK